MFKKNILIILLVIFINNNCNELKKALIIGVTGQDGSYLVEFLLKKGYEVHGTKRRSSSFNTNRINHLIKNEKNIFLCSTPVELL